MTCGRFARHKNVQTSLARPGLSLRITLLTATLITLVVAALTVYSYSRLYRQVEEKFGWTLEHIAKTAALGISGEEHSNIRGPADENSAEFRNIRDYLREVMRENDLTPETIYTFHPGANGELIFCVMLHEKPFIGDVYVPPPANRRLVEQALAGRSSYTRLYTDEHGRWISGYAPIRAKDGSVQGLLAVDYRVDRFIMALEREVLMNVLVGLLFVLFGPNLTLKSTHIVLHVI